MVAHIQNNHGTKDKKCKFCRIFFVNIRRMSRHITHIPRTETKVKVFVSDIPSHTNQNIGVFK